MDGGICSKAYRGNRKLQQAFRNFFGGGSELPMDIARRLQRDDKRNKNRRNGRNVKSKFDEIFAKK